MILRSLRLINFRNYEDAEFSFDEGANLFVGPNGSGKTNLAEAIDYLSLARSWRSQDAESLISEGCESSLVKAKVIGDSSHEIEIAISKRGKAIEVDGKRIRKLSELTKLVKVCLFSPEDVLIFRDSPSKRRNFLDKSLCQESETYLKALSNYEKLLKERNAVLKSENPNTDYLDAVTERMIEIIPTIIEERSAYLKRLSSTMGELAEKLYGENRSLEVQYLSFLEGKPSLGAIRKIFEEHRQLDLIRKSTSIGIQKEDFLASLDGKPIGEFGSQGENRLAAIAMKLSPCFMGDKERPIAVLDDVYSELDQDRSRRLGQLLEKLPQCFVTSSQPIPIRANEIDISNITRRK